MRKRILSVLLCVAFLLSMLPGLAFADNETTGEPAPTEESTPTEEPTSTLVPDPTEEPTPAETSSTAAPAEDGVLMVPALDSASTYSVTTGAATYITASSAHIGMTYSAPASISNYEYGIKIGTSSGAYNTTIEAGTDTKAADSKSASVSPSNLTPGTTYYYAAYIDNASASDIVQGTEKNFTTTTAQTLTTGSSKTLTTAGTSYAYKFTPASAGYYSFTLNAPGSIEVRNAAGTSLATGSDGGAGFSVKVSLSAGSVTYIYTQATSSGAILTAASLLSGTCGTNLTWMFNQTAGELTIRGTGAMNSYASASAPWYGYRNAIRSIVVESGVTGIGAGAFRGCGVLAFAYLPDSVTSIGADAFADCIGLTKVDYESTAAKWSAVVIGSGNACLTGASIECEQIPYSASTGDATDITSRNATLSFTYSAPKAQKGYQFGVEYGTASGDYSTSVTAGTGTVRAENASSSISPNGLVPGTTYYYAAYVGEVSATDTVVEGNENSFTTTAAQPITSGSSATLTEPGTCYAYKLTTSNQCYCEFTLNSAGSIEIANAAGKKVTSNSDGDSGFSLTARLTANTVYYIFTQAASSGAVLTVQNLLSGACGASVTWTFNPATGLMNLFGSGGMYDYTPDSAPWCGYEDSVLRVVVGSGVTGIGDRAFSGCGNLSSISLPSGLTSIGLYAFGDCAGLTGIELPVSLTDLQLGAFSGCTGLTEISLPSGVKSIGNQTFYGCAGLTEISLPAGVKSIGTQAFDGCTGLTDVYYAGTADARTAVTIGVSNTCLTAARWHCYLPNTKITGGSLNTAGKPTITWGSVSGAVKYCIDRKDEQTGIHNALETTQTAYTDTAVTTGHTYTYRITAQNSYGDSNIAGSVSVTVLATPVVTGNLDQNGHPKLTWSAIAGATTYNIYRRNSSTGQYQLLKAVSGTSYTDTGITYGQTYWYEIKAVSACKTCSNASNEARIVTVTTVTGWALIDGNYYYFVNRAKQFGWVTVNGSKYYLNPTTGIMATGWKIIAGKTYYFKGGSSGRMLTGWQEIGTKWYYFSTSDGHMLTGWQTIGTGRFYLDPTTGVMTMGWKTIAGRIYYFKGGDSGRLLTGWQLIGTKWYYFNTADGHMLTGWQTISTGRFYLDPTTGVMTMGWKIINGRTYYFKGGSSGRMLTGWQEIGTKWYYFNTSDGHMLTGWQVIGTGKYYLDPTTGAMATGLHKISGSWYYFKGGDSGRMLTGWQTIGTGRYYFDPKTGVMATGWKTIAGVTYYFKPGDSGRMVTGTYTIDGVRHTFGSDGRLIA